MGGIYKTEMSICSCYLAPWFPLLYLNVKIHLTFRVVAVSLNMVTGCGYNSHGSPSY